jgi:hypothetical protein
MTNIKIKIQNAGAAYASPLDTSLQKQTLISFGANISNSQPLNSAFAERACCVHTS